MELLPTMKRQKGVCQQRPSCFPFLSGSTIMNQIIPWKTRVALKGSLPRASACAWMSTSWRVLPSDRRPKISRSPTVTGIRCHWFFLDDFGSHFRLFDDWLMMFTLIFFGWCLHWFFSDEILMVGQCSLEDWLRCFDDFGWMFDGFQFFDDWLSWGWEVALLVVEVCKPKTMFGYAFMVANICHIDRFWNKNQKVSCGNRLCIPWLWMTGA